MRYYDLHRHDEKSTFDGFGKADEAAKYAAKLGYTALGISNHGNTSSLVEHHYACESYGIKPILGVEVYFLPEYDEIRDTYHLCLYAKNLTGYRNINRMITIANQEQFYYKPIVDYELLARYSEGVICTSACIGGILAKNVAEGKMKTAVKHARHFQELFKDDYYIEIQPYSLLEHGRQETANKGLMYIADKLNIRCILTSDSHRIKNKDYDTYIKLHEIGGHADYGAGYVDRYMPSENDIVGRFIDLHGKDFEDIEDRAEEYLDNLQILADSVEESILPQLPLKLPKYATKGTSKGLLWEHIIGGLKSRNRHPVEGAKNDDPMQKYVERCKHEYDVITHLGYEDYFLIVEDYVRWAKENDIAVGPGRGSVCNSLVAYALGITEVDSILFELDFSRFLRFDKKKLPDIDLDFETGRRDDVIDYILNKYEGYSARIASYGLYKVANLLNDLFKVCGLELADKSDPNKEYKDEEIKQEQRRIKSVVKSFIHPETDEFDAKRASKNAKVKQINKQYDNIIKHFAKMYMKIRYFGTHAAGVAISGNKIYNYVAIERRAKGVFTTTYDLVDTEKINVVKLDILGLKTMSVLKELRELTNTEGFDPKWLNDKAIFREFRKGNTDGIFQFESAGGKSVLMDIQTDCMGDVIAASALNRPGPLMMGMVEQYRDNKAGGANTDSVWYPYTKDTYGTFVYQEQIIQLCLNLAMMSWDDVDAIMGILKKVEKVHELRSDKDSILYELEDKFIKGCVKNGVKKKEALEIFNSILVYAFNKGHATGYALISLEQMYYKVYYPALFWYVTLKYTSDKDKWRLSGKAVRDGSLILIPHVNHGAMHQLKEIDGEMCIAEGLTSIKNVGINAALLIEKEKIENGDYVSYNDFIERLSPYTRTVNKRCITALKEIGALEFNEKVYYRKVENYNITLYARGAD